jgi:hypothetical protein
VISYSYSPEGQDDVVSLFCFDVGKAPAAFTAKDGTRYVRNLAADLRSQGRPPTKGWPIHCRGSAVHPSQAKELQDFLAKKGVATEVDHDGRPIYRNSNHQRKALAARGLVNRDEFTR